MQKLNSVSLPGILLAFTIGLAGCEEGPRGGPRLETYPITGVVIVNGEPAAVLRVVCNPSGQVGDSTSSSALTDEEGRFSISTYESGDGAPEGEYTLTFMWGQWDLTGRYLGPDKLKGAFTDSKKSKWTAVVIPGEPTDMGAIELITK